MWKKTILYLRRRGYSDAEIAAWCNCTERSINRLRTGQHRDTKYSIGVKLAELEDLVRREE